MAKLYKGRDLQAEFQKDNIRYAVSMGRRQPMHIVHVDCINEIINSGLTPIILCGSVNEKYDANGELDPCFNPNKNPLTFAQNKAQILLLFPDIPIIPMLDTPDLSPWVDNLIAILQNVPLLQQHGIATDKSILKQTVFHYRAKECDKEAEDKLHSVLASIDAIIAAGLSCWQSHNDNAYYDQISSTNLRDLDLNHLEHKYLEMFAAPEYIITLANQERARNRRVGPVTLRDLSVSRQT